MKIYPKNKAGIIRSLAFAVCAYLLGGLYLYVNQRSYIYFPSAQDFYQCESVDATAGSRQGTRYYYHEGGDTLVIFYHGNAGSACDRSFIIDYLKNFDASIFIVEYAGYSNDARIPSKELLYADAKNIRDMVSTLPHKKVIIIGESIGNGPASFHASYGGVDILILLSSFTSLSEVAQYHYKIYPARLLLKDNYSPLNNLNGSSFDGKLIVINGENDAVIPAKIGRRFFERVTVRNKQLIEVQNGGHNLLSEYPEVFNIFSEAVRPAL